jgi:hypothetical protein
MNFPARSSGFATVSSDAPSARLARAWLVLGVVALVGAGLLALLLVLSRTPGIQAVFPLRDFFRAALVVHVDLSVLIWFMAFAAVLWSLAGSARWPALGWGGWWLTTAGSALIAVSPFFPDAQPLLNNYIPVLQQPVFFAGLSLAAAGFGLTVLRALFGIPAQIRAGGLASADAALRFGAWLAALAAAVALGSFAMSWVNTPETQGQAFWEMVFWGGGHALQFQHALLLAVTWLWLAEELGAPVGASARLTRVLFVIAALPLLAVPLIYSVYPPGSGGHIAAFARLMEFGHPLMAPLILLSVASLWRVRRQLVPAKSALLASMGLFVVGGVLAYLIRGANVVIPAHYHGSIVGITLAFMGLSYVLLPRLGFRPASGRMALWQPYVYGGGQMLHVLGLAWSGGYGVQRKVAGAEQLLSLLPQQVGMGLMGLGGLIAIVGGLMFVLVCLRAMLPQRGPLTD